MNAGILFSGSSDGINNYYVGTSVYHINNPNLSFLDQTWNLASRISVHGGGSFPLQGNLSVFTSAIFQLQNKATEAELGGASAANLNKSDVNPTSVYLGAWYRVGDAIIPYVGLEIEGLRIGISYDINVSSLKSATESRGGSEFSIIYIKRPPTGGKSIPCPKF